MSNQILERLKAERDRRDWLGGIGITLMALSVVGFGVAFFGFWGTERGLEALSDTTDPFRTKFFQSAAMFFLSGTAWAWVAIASCVVGVIGGTCLSFRRN